MYLSHGLNGSSKRHALRRCRRRPGGVLSSVATAMAEKIGSARTAGISFFAHAHVHLTGKTSLQTYPRAGALQHIAASCNTTSRYGTSRYGQTTPAPVVSIRRPDITMTCGAYCRYGRTSWPTGVSRVERRLSRRLIARCGESGVMVRRAIPPMTSNATHCLAGC